MPHRVRIPADAAVPADLAGGDTVKMSVEMRLDALERIMSAFVSAVESATGAKIEQPETDCGTTGFRPSLRVIQGGKDKDQDGRRGDLRAV